MKPTNLLRTPSFCKGTARVFDIFGQLDSYRYSANPDAESIERDWKVIGQDLQNEISTYGKKISN